MSKNIIRHSIKWYFIALLLVLYSCASSGIPVTSTSEDAANVIAQKLMPILQELSKNKNITIAIIPFGGPKGKPTKFGKKMSALIQLHLVSQSWKLVEREQVEKVLNEQNLVSSGLVKESDYMRTGNLIGADYIIIGTTFYGKKALLVVKVIDVKTSAVEGIAQVYIAFKE